MNILIICSGNVSNFNFMIHQAFIYDQVEAIKQLDSDIKFDYFFIREKGVRGYLSNLKDLKSKIKKHKYDLIHAHVGLSGLLANFQRYVPVITTFHGSDINVFKMRIVSFLVELLSFKTIYVSEKLYKLKLGSYKKKCSVIPCGVDLGLFRPLDRKNERLKFGFKNDIKYILFSSSFKNKIKNFELLKNAISLLTKNLESIKVIELKGYTRLEVASLMNAVDLCVMTSFAEGSPQFIKEAMACNCPIVSTDVGDVRNVIYESTGSYVSTFTPSDVAEKIEKALFYSSPANGREFIKHFDNKLIAKKILTLYKEIINAKM